jgi:hypothetical protein
MEEKNTAKERLATVDKVLDEYESGMGLSLYSPDFHHDSAAQHYMGMSRQQMEKVTVEECAEAALLLGGLSFHLQRSFNRELARVNWAASSIKSLISGRESQYSGSWDSQYNQAVKEDEYTLKLNQIKIYAQQRADRLTYLANSVKNLSDLFVNLQRAKVNKHG